MQWAEPDLAARQLLALGLARISFLRPAERCRIAARCRLAEVERMSVPQLAAVLERRVGDRRRRPPPPGDYLARAARDQNYLTAGRVTCTFLWESGYPQALREIHDPPQVLFHRGELPPPAWPLIAVVGTRQPTGHGRDTAYAFALDLARCGIPTVSGLARGIDLEAHRGSLAGWRWERCATVAVLGCGIDRIYPYSSREVAREVVRRGCMVSEFPPGTEPHPHHFPLRNRIIAGLSRAVMVVEAPAKSGALITARCAADEGREVVVAAGPLGGARAAGSEALAAAGAPPVNDAGELLREVGLAPTAAAPPAPAPPAAAPSEPRGARGQRATGAWLARLFALEQERRVVVNNGWSFAVISADGEDKGAAAGQL